jgi:hypothetical protein
MLGGAQALWLGRLGTAVGALGAVVRRLALPMGCLALLMRRSGVATGALGAVDRALDKRSGAAWGAGQQEETNV